LPHLTEWNSRRREIAAFYKAHINNPLLILPVEFEYGRSNHHLYVVRSTKRDPLKLHLAERGVATLIHYPLPIHLQEAYRDLQKSAGDYPVAEEASREVLSLPAYPELTNDELEHVVGALNSFDGRSDI
jgi:dTDP-4-amino-4,6-dideoxygalactose transaminase